MYIPPDTPWILRNTVEKGADQVFIDIFRKKHITHVFSIEDIQSLNLSERARNALMNLPYCQSEIGISLRSMMKEKKKSKEDYLPLFSFYYKVCAILTMIKPFSRKLQQPGLNIMESIPGGLLFSLPVDYRNLGYKKILHGSEAKLASELWGEPDTHKTFNQAYRKIWSFYEDFLFADNIEDELKLKMAISETSDSMTGAGVCKVEQLHFLSSLLPGGKS